FLSLRCPLPLSPHLPPYTIFPYTTLFRSLELKTRDGRGQTVKVRTEHTAGHDRLDAAARAFLAENGLPEDTVDRLHPTLETSYQDRKSTRLNSSHVSISYAVFCLKKKKQK